MVPANVLVTQRAIIKKFYAVGCCSRRCTTHIQPENLLRRRLLAIQMSQSCRDFFVLGQLLTSHIIESPHLNSLRHDTRRAHRERNVFRYSADHTICRDLFLLMNATGVKRYRTLLGRLKNRECHPVESVVRKRKVTALTRRTKPKQGHMQYAGVPRSIKQALCTAETSPAEVTVQVVRPVKKARHAESTSRPHAVMASSNDLPAAQQPSHAHPGAPAPERVVTPPMPAAMGGAVSVPAAKSQLSLSAQQRVAAQCGMSFAYQREMYRRALAARAAVLHPTGATMALGPFAATGLPYNPQFVRHVAPQNPMQRMQRMHQQRLYR